MKAEMDSPALVALTPPRNLRQFAPLTPQPTIDRRLRRDEAVAPSGNDITSSAVLGRHASLDVPAQMQSEICTAASGGSSRVSSCGSPDICRKGSGSSGSSGSSSGESSSSSDVLAYGVNSTPTSPLYPALGFPKKAGAVAVAPPAAGLTKWRSMPLAECLAQPAAPILVHTKRGAATHKPQAGTRPLLPNVPFEARIQVPPTSMSPYNAAPRTTPQDEPAHALQHVTSQLALRKATSAGKTATGLRSGGPPPPRPYTGTLTCACWEAGISGNAPCSIPRLCGLRTMMRQVGLFHDPLGIFHDAGLASEGAAPAVEEADDAAAVFQGPQPRGGSDSPDADADGADATTPAIPDQSIAELSTSTEGDYWQAASPNMDLAAAPDRPAGQPQLGAGPSPFQQAEASEGLLDYLMLPLMPQLGGIGAGVAINRLRLSGRVATRGSAKPHPPKTSEPPEKEPQSCNDASESALITQTDSSPQAPVTPQQSYKVRDHPSADDSESCSVRRPEPQLSGAASSLARTAPWGSPGAEDRRQDACAAVVAKAPVSSTKAKALQAVVVVVMAGDENMGEEVTAAVIAAAAAKQAAPKIVVYGQSTPPSLTRVTPEPPQDGHASWEVASKADAATNDGEGNGDEDSDNELMLPAMPAICTPFPRSRSLRTHAVP